MNSIDLLSDDDDVFEPKKALRKRPNAQSLHIGGKSMRRPNNQSGDDDATTSMPYWGALGDVGTDVDAFGCLQSILSEYENMKAQNAKLRSEKATRDEEIATLQSTVESKDKLLKKREAKKTTAVVAAATTSKTPSRISLEKIVTDCTSAVDEDIRMAKLKVCPQSQANASTSTTSTSTTASTLEIVQKNLAQQFLTERLVAARADTSGVYHWYYDSSTPPTPQAPVWSGITDPAVCQKLWTLGRTVANGNGDVTDFQPTVGLNVKYTFNQHTYEVSVLSRAASTTPSVPVSLKWQEDVLNQKYQWKVTPQALDKMLKDVDFDQPDAVVQGSKLVADLATSISTAGQGFTYDAQKCQLWVKPLWLKVWLTVAKTRKFTEARLLLHGMRSGDYQKLSLDMAGFDMNYSKDGLKNYGFYGAVSDHIASDYHSGTDPTGTCYIGLLWVKASLNHGAYEHYHLGSNKYPKEYSRRNDAYAVRDQLLWLPIGLAVAAK